MLQHLPVQSVFLKLQLVQSDLRRVLRLLQLLPLHPESIEPLHNTVTWPHGERAADDAVEGVQVASLLTWPMSSLSASSCRICFLYLQHRHNFEHMFGGKKRAELTVEIRFPSP
jgi:hypothetical protein